jgi:zinc transport system substrate-binding protein
VKKQFSVFPSRERNRSLIAMALAVVCLSSCERSTSDSDGGSGAPVIFASVPPVAGLVKHIVGDRIRVETLASANDDPHGYSPTPKQLVALGDADAFFVVGMPFEHQLVDKLKSGARQLRIIDVASDIERLEMDEHHHHHHHGHDDEHGHDEGDDAEHESEGETNEATEHDHETESDPHVWLSPALLKKQAMLIESALYDIDPDGHDVYHANLETLLANLDALDVELKSALAPWKGQSFYVYHGAFAYFAEAYGMTQEAIEIGGRSPEPKRVFELIEQAKADGVRLILVQPQFSTNSAEAIAEGINGTVVPVNPLEENVFATLRTLAEKVKLSQPAKK